MRYRKLRIAWSVVCGVTALLLVLIWVRYRDAYIFKQFKTRDVLLLLDRGRLHIRIAATRKLPLLQDASAWSIREDMYAYDDIQYMMWSDPNKLVEPRGRFGFQFASSPLETRMRISFWAILVPVLIAAVLPWLRWRYGLRTLLIATTLVAVVLGLIAYLNRPPRPDWESLKGRRKDSYSSRDLLDLEKSH